MSVILTNHRVHRGRFARLVEIFTKEFSEFRKNTKAQQASWQRYHRSTAGWSIPRRAWMRHGAMLKQISQRSA